MTAVVKMVWKAMSNSSHHFRVPLANAGSRAIWYKNGTLTTRRLAVDSMH
jgi:hypothetical protein